MNESPRLTAETALAINDPTKMLAELLELYRLSWQNKLGGQGEILRMIRDGDTSHPELGKTPELVEMVRILNAFDADVVVSGVAKFLTDGDCGEHIEDAKRWCHLIGATRAAEYLAAVEQKFPGGRIPQKTVERENMVEEFDNRSPSGAFAELDIVYKGSTEEMVSHLQSYLRAHKQEVIKAFGMST